MIAARCVAPHAGAWIEIRMRTVQPSPPTVAPHAGAWIEILAQQDMIAIRVGRTPRGCVD